MKRGGGEGERAWEKIRVLSLLYLHYSSTMLGGNLKKDPDGRLGQMQCWRKPEPR